MTPFSHDLLGGVIPGNTSASGRGPQRCRFAVIVDSGQSSIIKCSVGDVLYAGEKVMSSTTKVILAGMALTSLGLTLSGPVPARTLVARLRRRAVYGRFAKPAIVHFLISRAGGRRRENGACVQ